MRCFAASRCISFMLVVTALLRSEINTFKKKDVATIIGLLCLVLDVEQRWRNSKGRVMRRFRRPRCYDLPLPRVSKMSELNHLLQLFFYFCRMKGNQEWKYDHQVSYLTIH